MNRKLKNLSLKHLTQSEKKENDIIIDLSMTDGHFSQSFQADISAYEAILNYDLFDSSPKGDKALRQQFIEKYYSKFSIENEIMITNGTTQGLFNVFVTLINKGDEVILFSPCDRLYESIIQLLGGLPVIVDTSSNQFKVNEKILENYITKKTKAIILNEPNNPTGMIYSVQEKIEFIDLVKRHKFFIIIDESYRLFTPKHFVSYSDLIYDQKVKDQFIFINGLSKSHLLKKYKIGCVISNPIINEQLVKLSILSVGSISNVMQQSAIGALLDEEHTQFVRHYYLNNLELLKEELKDLKIEYVNSSGAYFLLMNIESFNMTGVAFCNALKEKYQINLLPGNVYGINYESYVRVSCCVDVMDLIKFIKYLNEFHSLVCDNNI